MTSTGDRAVALTVNGGRHEVAAHPDTPLLHVLRNVLGLKGSRFGCGAGLCGACFVQVDGRPVPACDTPLWAVEGRAVTTVEGLAADGRLHPVQEAFVEETAFQCSFCTPGMLLATKALLAENPDPTDEDVKDYLAGNLCRCGSYLKILAAVRNAARRLRAR